jgi:NAD-reducing hydrogenase large subunit
MQQGMLNRVEAVVRAFDPCLSCSTHAAGQMPLKIELRNPDGELLDTLVRGLRNETGFGSRVRKYVAQR